MTGIYTATPNGNVSTVKKWRLINGEYVPVIIDEHGDEHEVVWAAQEGSAAAFLDSTEFEVLYSGTRGCGKTDALLMSYGRDVGCGWGPALKGLILRQHFPDLKEVVSKSQKWFPRLWPGCEYNELKYRWTFPEGETLTFDHLPDRQSFHKFLGWELTFIGFEELITWETLELYKLMFSCIRSSVPGIPLKIRSTTNPYGPCHTEIAERFDIMKRKPGTILGPLVCVDDEEGRPEPPRRAIFGHIKENKLLMKTDPGYMGRLLAGAPNEALQKAWGDGDWRIPSGGMFGDIWATHQDAIMIPNFEVPDSWKIYRSFDDGSSSPFVCLWFARSDGSDLVFPDGHVMPTLRGDWFIVGEDYGSTGRRNEGINITTEEKAARIIKFEIERGWRTEGHCRVRRGPADTSIWAEVAGRPSIATDFELPIEVNGMKFRGIIWEQADKRAGSEPQGTDQIRKRMFYTKPIEGATKREHAGLFVCECCANWIRTVPLLQRDEKDPNYIMEKSEDHCFDATRYMLRYELPPSGRPRRINDGLGGRSAAPPPPPNRTLNQAGYGRGAPPPGGMKVV